MSLISLIAIVFRGVLLGAMQPGAGAATNMFFWKVNNQAWNNNAYGLLIYNVSEYRPTCGWKIIVTSSYPICYVKVWDGTTEQVDDHTVIVTGLSYMASNANRQSDIDINGLFLNTWPAVTANYLCVCNATSANVCQNVTYDTEPPTNAILSNIPCAASSTTAATTTTTTTTVRSPSLLPALTVADIYLQSPPAAFSGIKLNVTLSTCYLGALYTPLTQIPRFVDCCSLCGRYRPCAGINYHPAARECDLVTENAGAAGSNRLGPAPDCTYWIVVNRW